MTFEYRDQYGHHLSAEPGLDDTDTPVAVLWVRGLSARVPVRIPADRVEELVAGVRDAARQARGQHRPPCIDGDHCGGEEHCPPAISASEIAARQASGQQPPAVAYGDGKGRVYCLGCASTVGATVPLTVNVVDHWEVCPSCGRHVVDVARQRPAVGVQDATQPTTDGCLRSKLAATKDGAAGALEVLAFDLATASKLIEPTDVRTAIAAHRAEVLQGAEDAVEGLLIEDENPDERSLGFNTALDEVVATLRRLAAGAES
jgi:hypothetical protein